MADFEAVIGRTIEGLVDNTPEKRAQVYEKARLAVDRQLRSMNPRPSETMVRRQMRKVESAILAVETGKLPRAKKDDGALQVGPDSDVKNAPSSILLEWVLPPSIAADFLGNILEIHEDYWVPAFGERKARWRWHRECVSMILRHWVQLCGVNACRFWRLK